MLIFAFKKILINIGKALYQLIFHIVLKVAVNILYVLPNVYVYVGKVEENLKRSVIMADW